MQTEHSTSSASTRAAWNAGMIIGPKAPLKAKHIWEIRTRLKMAAKLRIADVMAGGTIRLRSTVVQQKTGRPVPFELTDPTREALVDWLKIRRAVGCDWLFPGRLHAGEHLTTRQYARLVDAWARWRGSTQPPTASTACAGQRSPWCTSALAISAPANFRQRALSGAGRPASAARRYGAA